MTLVQYYVCSFQLRRKTFGTALNKRTIDASIDQWHSRLKTLLCAEGGHFKHMT